MKKLASIITVFAFLASSNMATAQQQGGSFQGTAQGAASTGGRNAATDKTIVIGAVAVLAAAAVAIGVSNSGNSHSH